MTLTGLIQGSSNHRFRLTNVTLRLLIIFSSILLIVVCFALNLETAFANSSVTTKWKYPNGLKIKQGEIQLHLEKDINAFFERKKLTNSASIEDPIEQIVDDLKYVMKAHLPKDSEMQDKWGLKATTGQGWIEWMSDRINVISAVSDHTKTDEFINSRFDYDTTKQIVKVRDGSLPPFNERGEILPGYDSGIPDLSKNSDVTAMNLSSALMLNGLKAGFPIIATVSGFKDSDTTYVDSTRFGFVLLRDAFFSDSTSTDHFINSNFGKINRLAMLVHEARHGDGHGKHLGFGHSDCPDDHVYSGRNACDRSQNGSYSVDADFIRLFLDACKIDRRANDVCGDAEMAAMQGMQLGVKYRVLDPEEYPTDPSGLEVVEYLDPKPATLIIRDL